MGSRVSDVGGGEKLLGVIICTGIGFTVGAVASCTLEPKVQKWFGLGEDKGGRWITGIVSGCAGTAIAAATLAFVDPLRSGAYSLDGIKNGVKPGLVCGMFGTASFNIVRLVGVFGRS